METNKQYSVWLANPRYKLWGRLLIVVSIFGMPLTSISLGVWFDYLLGGIGGLVGVFVGLGMWLGSLWWFDRWAEDAALATVEADRLIVVKQHTAEREEFLFRELSKYRVLANFRRRSSLLLIATNGRRLALRSPSSPEFAALIKAFDISTLRYERLSGKRFTRIDMG